MKKDRHRSSVITDVHQMPLSTCSLTEIENGKKEPSAKSRGSNFLQLYRDNDLKYAAIHSVKNYFPRYTLQTSAIVHVEERPPWIQCVAYGIQHVLAMFSGVIVLPLILGYDSNTSLFFSGVCTIVFFIITGGRVPSYLGCSGSVTSVILSVTGYEYSATSGPNSNISQVQGALLILSLTYILISIIVILFGYKWLEFLMPPIVTGSIITSIGLHLSFISFNQITKSSFDTYMATVTAASIMLLSVYAPTNTLRRISLLLGTIIGYTIHAICGIKQVGPPIDFSEIVSSPWVRAPRVYYDIKFNTHAVSMAMPILVVLLAENLGHMKAIGSLTGPVSGRPISDYIGRCYLGDSIGCLLASIAGTIPFTTYAENIGVLSVTQVYSPLVILFAATFAMLLGFFAKFSAVVKSIPQGVLGGVTLVLYALIAITGVRIWVKSKIDFDEPRNIYIAGIPVILATVMQSPVQLGDFQLDGIGVATFLSIILYQVLRGYEGIRNCCRYIRSRFHRSP